MLAFGNTFMLQLMLKICGAGFATGLCAVAVIINTTMVRVKLLCQTNNIVHKLQVVRRKMRSSCVWGWDH